MTNMRAIRRAYKRPLFKLRFFKRTKRNKKIMLMRRPNFWKTLIAR